MISKREKEIKEAIIDSLWEYDLYWFNHSDSLSLLNKLWISFKYTLNSDITSETVVLYLEQDDTVKLIPTPVINVKLSDDIPYTIINKIAWIN